MNDREKIVLSKLLKIASNQQKIIERLAQTQDPNIAYLKSAAQITAANSGFNASHVEVTANPGGPGSDPSVQTMAGYTIKVSGAPPKNDLREKFTRQLKAMVASQKPDQAGLANLSVLFV